MSNPVTNVEIEDVLSSIRRLVSNESRGADADPKSEASRNAEQPESGADALGAPKLVLTPSFRVDETLHEDPPLPDAALSGPAPQRTVVDGPAAETRDDSTPDSEIEDTDDAREEFHAGADDEDDEADHAAFEEDDEDQSDNWDVDEEADSDSEDARDVITDTVTALKERVAEMEQAVAGRSEQWEPDGASDDDYAGGEGEPLPWEDYVPSDTGGDADGNTESDAEDDDSPAATEAPQAEDAESADAPDEASTGAEKPAATATDSAKDTLASDETAQAEPFGDNEAPMPEATHSEDRLEDETANLLGLDDDADAILDEDALRDLVTEIVRQELQGGLGERITRNVRKLVRREIHRALASQELE